MKKIIFSVLALFVSTAKAFELPTDGRVDIWPTIPFFRGADLCKFKDAYSQTRTAYMATMVDSAERLFRANATGDEILNLLQTFNETYDRNQALATRSGSLDITLESTLKASLDQLYRDIRPRNKVVSFNHVQDLLRIVSELKKGDRTGTIDQQTIEKLDYIAYGTYTLAPNCQGEIQVILTMVGKNGLAESFQAIGKPETVMQQIASEVFTYFQRTQFPTSLRIGNSTLTLVGALNGSVDKVNDPNLANQACATLGARLPTSVELDLINAYGDWSGGVSLYDKVWALDNGKIFAPFLRNPSPIRQPWEVNEREFYYYCVR